MLGKNGQFLYFFSVKFMCLLLFTVVLFTSVGQLLIGLSYSFQTFPLYIFLGSSGTVVVVCACMSIALKMLKEDCRERSGPFYTWLYIEHRFCSAVS